MALLVGGPAGAKNTTCTRTLDRAHTCKAAFVGQPPRAFLPALWPRFSAGEAPSTRRAVRQLCGQQTHRFAPLLTGFSKCLTEKTCDRFSDCFRSVRVQLAKPQPAGSALCKAGSDYAVHPNGRISFCTLAKAAMSNAIPLATEAYTLFHGNGAVWQTTLAKEVRFSLANKRAAVCRASAASFYQNGHLGRCDLAKPLTTKRGISCAAGKDDGAAFYDDGSIASCTLGAPLVVAIGQGKLSLPAGASVSIERSGAIRGGYLASAATVDGLSISGDFSMHTNGRLQRGTLVVAATISGQKLAADDAFSLRSDGSLERSVHEDHSFMPHGEPRIKTTTRTYDAAGKITNTKTDVWTGPSRPPKGARKSK